MDNYFAAGNLTIPFIGCFVLSCIAAFVLNYAVVLCMSYNSALTTACIGPIKVMLTRTIKLIIYTYAVVYLLKIFLNGFLGAKWAIFNFSQEIQLFVKAYISRILSSLTLAWWWAVIIFSNGQTLLGLFCFVTFHSFYRNLLLSIYPFTHLTIHFQSIFLRLLF